MERRRQEYRKKIEKYKIEDKIWCDGNNPKGVKGWAPAGVEILELYRMEEGIGP